MEKVPGKGWKYAQNDSDRFNWRKKRADATPMNKEAGGSWWACVQICLYTRAGWQVYFAM